MLFVKNNAKIRICMITAKYFNIIFENNFILLTQITKTKLSH